MNRKYVLVAVLIAALIGALFYFYGGSQVPPGQPPLQRLTAENLPQIKNAFNESKDNVRALVFLSPT